MLEANEQRRVLLRARERPHWVSLVVAALGSVAMWVRERPVRLAAASAVAILAISALMGLSSVTEGEPERLPIAALPETGQGNPVGTVTVTLSTVGNETDGEPDGDPDAEADGEPGAEADGEPGAAYDAQGAAPSSDQEQGTADADRETAPAASSGSTAPGPAPAPEPEPELSDTGGSNDPPATEPKPADPPASEPSGNDEPDQDETREPCLLEVSLLGVRLCV
jgi:hypothetical protein